MTQKSKYRATGTPLKTMGERRCPEGSAAPAPHVLHFGVIVKLHEHPVYAIWMNTQYDWISYFNHDVVNRFGIAVSQMITGLFRRNHNPIRSFFHFGVIVKLHEHPLI
jgi:hypothetical protein